MFILPFHVCIQRQYLVNAYQGVSAINIFGEQGGKYNNKDNDLIGWPV